MSVPFQSKQTPVYGLLSATVIDSANRFLSPLRNDNPILHA